ncbi:MAG TPA: carboxypeptidase-like regulatory domain-containing protein [Prolixibacteraceae bacterium]|nr:carboxypeptidase-like regulatory domain-containing protein [Prolixibacteraceae bacterium]
MKKIIILCAMVLFVCTVVAQNKISGKVTNQHHAPLPGATVSLPELNKGTMTNEKGEYELTNLPNGKNKVQFSFVGYASDIKTVLLNNA